MLTGSIQRRNQLEGEKNIEKDTDGYCKIDRNINWQKGETLFLCEAVKSFYKRRVHDAVVISKRGLLIPHLFSSGTEIEAQRFGESHYWQMHNGAVR